MKITIGSKNNETIFERFGNLKRSGDARTVLCDFDYPFSAYKRRKGPRLARFFAVFHVLRIVPLSILQERTRRGWHVTVKLKEKDALYPAEMVALQFALGSDQRRETLNLMRAISARKMFGNPKQWHPRLNLLFERKL